MLFALDNEATLLTRLVMCTDNLRGVLVADTPSVSRSVRFIMVVSFPPQKRVLKQKLRHGLSDLLAGAFVM